MSIGSTEDDQVYITIADDVGNLPVRDTLADDPAALDIVILGNPGDVLQVPPTLCFQLPSDPLGGLAGDCRYLRYRTIVNHVDCNDREGVKRGHPYRHMCGVDRSV